MTEIVEPTEPYLGNMSSEEAKFHTDMAMDLISVGEKESARLYLDYHISKSREEYHAQRLLPPEETEEVFRSGFDKFIGGLSVAAAAGALVFEQGPANEALRTKVALDVLTATSNEIAVGVATAALTYGIEFGSSALLALGAHKEGQRVEKLISKFKKDDKGKSEEEHNKNSHFKENVTDAGIALGVGAAIVIARKRLVDPKRTLGEDLKTGAKASAVIAGVSGMIGYLAAGGIEHAKSVGLEKPAQYFVDYATDWKFWAGVLACVYAGSYIKEQVKRFRTSKNETDKA